MPWGAGSEPETKAQSLKLGNSWSYHMTYDGRPDTWRARTAACRGVATYPVEPGVDGVSSGAGLDRDLTGGPAGTVIRIGVQRHADGDSPGHEGQRNGGRQHRDVRPPTRIGTGTGRMATWAGAGRETAGALIALEASSMAVAKANGHT